jgi:hypothetical protein
VRDSTRATQKESSETAASLGSVTGGASTLVSSETSTCGPSTTSS